MKRAYILAVAVGSALAVWATIALRGQFLHTFTVVCCLAAAVMLCLAWIGLFALRKRTPKVAAARHACSWAVVVLIVVSSSYLWGALVRQQDVRRAQQFCQQIAASVDAWRREHGSYPESLDSVLPEGLQAPLLLQHAEDFYVSDGDGYVLSFSDEAGMLDSGMIYTSDDHQWLRVPRND
ncbi:MAG: hypothetical protein HY000_31275 [Planctomycetes bacterium]|nr:hypothetical protein [Planctomycetota bacterium]